MNLQEFFSALGQELGLRTSLTVLLLTFALLMARILPPLVMSPFLGGDAVPPELKFGLGALLGVVMFPAVSERISFVPTAALPYLALMVKELFIGFSLSFVVSMVFFGAEAAGTLVDTMAGTNQAQVHVPQIQQQVSLFASLKMELSVVLFLTLNGHHVVIAAFGESLALIPLDQFPKLSAGAWAFFELILRTFAHLMLLGVALAAPVFLAAFLTDLALGMVNRVAPQVQVFFISMQIKPAVTVLIIFVSIHLILQRLSSEYARMLGLLDQAIRLLT